eukprot:scpid16890/ scgid2632/ Bifunctional protein NCOAT; Meningioma-expressed antigen 5; Nuclear cytoplasmic O-GlcNAcase and acetyltransferase; Beta-hexosaminidase; Beta-N-acetylhexosaminidase; Hexosaminidase C; N-acetyl-beta-D-glucosaminidase; N-acetyl-beta-glucosaminidase; O-GlcNAcase; Histone acetyltransferase
MNVAGTSESSAMEVDTTASACPCPVPPRRFISGVVEGFYGQPWPTDQRERLFQRLGHWGMNSYMYAPKDDAKHRQQWREPLSPSELDTVSNLMNSCRAEGVDFIFAISPGLDMTYSSEQELNFLKYKLDQVARLGCKSFAVLFDDIELRMCDADNLRFTSFAHAHVHVTNAIYEYLGKPRTFLFCPTEYCGSRAVPSVSESQYLHTVGTQLDIEISVLWTGPLVIPRDISVQSIQEVGKVLRRRPVIWDNLHANDYDRQRVFLGPYQGRPLTLRRYIRGVLTNPNCECEANFVAMHTLSTWCSTPVPPAEPPPAELSTDTKITPDSPDARNHASQAAAAGSTAAVTIGTPRPPSDVTSGTNSSNNATATDALTLSSSCGSNISVLSEIRTSDDEFYCARHALQLALAEWSLEVNTARIEHPAELATSADRDSHRSVCSPIGSVDSACVLSSSTIPPHQHQQQEQQAVHSPPTPVNPQAIMEDDHLALLVDVFHLPHEHGSVSTHLLKQISWLWRSCGWSSVDPASVLQSSPQSTSNALLEEVMCDTGCVDVLEQLNVYTAPAPSSPKEDVAMSTCSLLQADAASDVDMQSSPASSFSAVGEWSHDYCQQWRQQAAAFHQTCRSLQTMATRFLDIPNHPLLNSIFSCIVELQAALNKVDSFVSRLESLSIEEQRRLILYWSEPSMQAQHSSNSLDCLASQWNDSFEPWCVRGGLPADLQRILPDLTCLTNPPPSLSTDGVAAIDDDSGISDVPTTPPHVDITASNASALAATLCPQMPSFLSELLPEFYKAQWMIMLKLMMVMVMMDHIRLLVKRWDTALHACSFWAETCSRVNLG